MQIIPGLHIEGQSIGGILTNLRLPQWDLMFDIGHSPYESTLISQLFITHGHPDHCGALGLYLFQRYWKKLPTPKVFAPPSLIPFLEKISLAFSQIHKATYPATYIPVQPDQFIELGSRFIKARLAPHTIETYCYSIYQNKETPPIISYTGDTDILILDHHEELLSSQVLVIECTHLMNKKPSQPDRYKHVSLSDIFERASLFKNEKILLVHRSAEKTEQDFQELIKQRAPATLKDKLLLF